MTKIYIDEKTATDEKFVLLGNTELKNKQDFKFTFILVKSITPLLHLPPLLLNSFEISGKPTLCSIKCKVQRISNPRFTKSTPEHLRALTFEKPGGKKSRNLSRRY